MTRIEYIRRGVESGQAMTIDDIDMCRAAKLLIEKHGDEAATIAIKRATEMLDAGDVDGHAVWKRTLQAIEQLESTKPGPDDLVQ